MSDSAAIAATPTPPYYAVIFTSVRTDADDAGYAAMSQKMAELAAEQPGYLGRETARNEIGISVSYWESLEAIAAWKRNAEHQVAQGKGRGTWYSAFRTRVCKVEREFGFGA